MKKTAIAAIVLLFGATSSSPHAVAQPCDMQEISSQFQAYDELVCGGLTYYGEENYVAARKVFQAALEMKLFEYPNFEVLPRLTAVSLRLNDQDRAIKYFEQATVSVMLLKGDLKCVETNEGFHLEASKPENRSILADVSTPVIVGRMCGGVYESLYTLDQAVVEEIFGDYFSYYLVVQGEVKKSGANRPLKEIELDRPPRQ